MDHLARHERIFEALRAVWHRPSTRRGIGRALIGAFFLSIVSIELSRQGLLPELFGKPIPTNHLAAIAWVFTLLLIVEILDLGVKAGVVEKSGSWYSFQDERIGQGRENAKGFLRDNPETALTIEDKIRAAHGLDFEMSHDDGVVDDDD